MSSRFGMYNSYLLVYYIIHYTSHLVCTMLSIYTEVCCFRKVKEYDSIKHVRDSHNCKCSECNCPCHDDIVSELS